MKKSALIFLGLLGVTMAQASDVELIVQKVDNQGLVPGNTYRVYASLSEGYSSVHAVFGSTETPMMIESTAPFYNHPFGGATNVNISDATIQADAALAYDTWVTLGYENGEGNDLWDLGVDLTDFSTGGSIMVNNGAWFLLPTDEKCAPNNLGLVLLGQFTTTGVATGTINLQGWVNPQESWQKTGLTFTTVNAEIFGCTNPQALNFNAAATYDDQTCDLPTNGGSGNNVNHSGHNQQSGGHDTASKEDGLNSWDVFPNPVKENIFHVQFKNAIDFTKGNVNLELYDGAGRRVTSVQVNEGMVIGGNRIMVQQPLNSGTYKVVMTAEGMQESKTMVVQK
jgi:hypothetical protein